MVHTKFDRTCLCLPFQLVVSSCFSVTCMRVFSHRVWPYFDRCFRSLEQTNSGIFLHGVVIKVAIFIHFYLKSGTERDHSHVHSKVYLLLSWCALKIQWVEKLLSGELRLKMFSISEALINYFYLINFESWKLENQKILTVIRS